MSCFDENRGGMGNRIMFLHSTQPVLKDIKASMFCPKRSQEWPYSAGCSTHIVSGTLYNSSNFVLAGL